MVKRAVLSLFGLAGVFAGVSCGSDDIQAPTSGSIEITSVTSGPEPDADGYAVSIDDGAEAPLGANETLQRDGLEPGSHSVRLDGMAANCSAGGDNPRVISVRAGETTTVTFQVTCTPTTGSLEITASTMGASPDPDGYTISLDGSERGTIGASASVTLDALTAGSHNLGLGGVAGNCQVQGDNPRPVSITAGASATVSFAVVCSAPPPVTGSIQITVVTSSAGGPADPDGYTVTLDEGAAQPIGANATMTIPSVSPGAHRVSLDGLSANCLVQGDNPLSVMVTAGATAPAAFSISCSAASGAQIAFLAYDWVQQDIYVMNEDGSALQNVTRGASRRYDETYDAPSWSPDGKRILFLGTSYEWDDPAGDIYVIDRDGANLKNLTAPAGSGQAYVQVRGRSPAWSPDGRKIAYADGGGIYSMDSDGTHKTRLNPGCWRRDPDWSPDGRRIVYENGCLYSTQIEVMNADGTGVARLTRFGVDTSVYDALWSPDGSKISFRMQVRVQRELGIRYLADYWVMNADGTGATKITDYGDETYFNSQAAWSPDGSRIAVALGGIQVMNPDGTGLVKLGVDGSDPEWSPDGSKLAFTFAAADVKADIFVINADGTGLRNLTNSPEVSESFPTWSP